MADEQQGNIRPETNSATTGLNMDQSVNQIPKGTLTYALNAAVENFDSNSVNYQNEPGNEFCLQFPDGYQLIGEHLIAEKNKHIFFLVNPVTNSSEIGYMDNNDCIYHTLVNADCLNFNIQHPIHKAVHKLTNCTTEIYWTDGLNPRRYLDIDNIPYIQYPTSDPCNPIYTNILDCNQIKVQPNFQIPNLEVTDIRTGGDLKAGTYQFAIQYASANGDAYTSYYSVTNPTPIANIQITTPNFDYPVGRSIEVTISNIELSGLFQYFNLAVIKTINNIASVELIGTYFIEQTTQQVIYTGQVKTDIRLTVDDIFQKYPYYDIAQDLTTASDILIWDNLTSIDRINYQKIASGITFQWETYRIPATENYADELNATNLRGYLRDEVYAFEIVFLLKNGKQTDGFHIPGRLANGGDTIYIPSTNADFIGDPDYSVGPVGYSQTWKIYNTASVTGFSPGYIASTEYKGPYQYGEFAYWESAEKYPCNEELWGDLADQPIRHHKFPDVLVSPVFESALFTTPKNMVMQRDAVFPIGVKIDIAQVASLISGSSLTQAQKDDIAGFKIVRGDRSVNRSIVGKGILRNVASYDREGTTYYFPNYPYNDLRKDPFLLDGSNSYSITTGSNVGSNTICRSFSVTVLSAGSLEYIDCTTLNPTTIPVVPGKTYNICAIDFPRPTLVGTTGVIVCNTYIVYKITSNTPAGQTTFKYYNPFNSAFNGCVWNLLTGNPKPPPSGTDWVSYCLSHTADACCGFVSVPPSLTTNITVNTITGPRYVWALSIPTYSSGDGDYTIEQINVVTGACEPLPLDTYNTDSAKYRMVFNSPETSFGQPFLGDVLKLENVMFGAGRAHFVQVKKNAMYRLITKEAQEDALNSANNIAKITGTGANYNATALFAAYQAYLTIYINGITRRNYGYSFNSIASYDYSKDINNNGVDVAGYLGVKQRQLDIAQYLIPGVQAANDDHTVNNFQRESSVYLKTTEVKKDVSRTYTTFRICNTNLSGPNDQIFQYTDPTLGVQTITIAFNSCSTINSFTYPVETSGNISFTVTVTGQSQVTLNISTPPLPFAEDTPTMVASGASLVTDNSRFLPSTFNNCAKPAFQQDINVISYYASLKNIFVNQYGQINSYDTVDTGFQRDITPISGPTTATIFGGDTFISKFAFKTKLPFFIDNRVEAPDDSDIFYDELGNVAYPKYWHSARSVLFNASVNNVALTNFISIKAHNLDCPNEQTPITSAGRTYYGGNMYMFAYGIPYFYCESSYNVDLRQAFNIKEGDFWPHVSTSIPDDWVQESYVSIANDNTYNYNVTYSKQNKENTFTHLPSDWNNVCYTNYPFRAVYSNTQDSSPDIRVNNWLIYLPTSYFDFPRNYGNLTSLDGIQNKGVLARFENKSLLYNTLLTVDTSNPKAAYMGNDSLFRSSPPIDFAETDLGYVGSQHKILLKIPQGQITIDAKRGQVFLISGNQAQDISAFGSGMNRFFTDHLAFEILRHFPDADIDNHFNGLGLHGVYDSKYDRVIITKLDYIPQPGKDVKYDAVSKEFYTKVEFNGESIRNVVYLTDVEYFCNKSWTLSYNINTRSWISFHSYIPNFYIAENNFFYSGQNDCCSDFEAIVATLIPDPGKTTTTTTSTSTSSTTTTSTTTTAFTGCDLEGTLIELLCDLAGDAVEIYVTTTTTTTLPCDCHAGQINDNGVYYYTDCTGEYKSSSGASGVDICYDVNKPYSENITDGGISILCVCGPATTTTTTTSTTTTTTTTCYCTDISFIIYQTDLDAAASNTNPALDGKVFFNYVGCDGVAAQVSFTEAGTYTNNMCACTIDANGFYYTNNVLYPALSLTSTGGPCSIVL